MRMPSAFASVVATFLLLLAMPGANAGSGVAHDLDIASGTLSEALRRLADQANVQMVFYVKDAQSLKAGPLRGRYTPEQALDLLLRGSDLVYQYVDERTISVRRRSPSADSNGMSAVKPLRGDRNRVALRLAQVSDTKAETGEGAKAQVAEPPIEEGETQSGQGDEAPVVTVTGSRIRSLLGEADFTPVISFNRAEIERAGITTIGELGRLIPQAFSEASYDGLGFGGQSTGTFVTSDGSAATAVYTSRATFNLRGLGTQNTLVLLNGRRTAASGVSQGNDASNLAGIPISSIERIEVLTDGASAIYGSDAVGGVINIIQRKDYVGTEASLSYENTFDSDTAVRTATLAHSARFGRLTASLSATFQDRNAFAASDRYFSATDDWSSLGATNPFFALAVSLAGGGNSTGAGIIEGAFGNLPGRDSPFAVIPDNADGTLRPVSDYISVEGDFFGVPAYTDDRAKYVNIISPQRNRSTSVRLSYELGASLDLFADASYGDTITKVEGLPVNYRNYLLVPADYPGNPFGELVYLHKTFWELGNINGQKDATTSSAAASVGLRGALGSSWRFETSFDWNRSVVRDRNAWGPDLLSDAYQAAIDAEQLVLFYDSRTQTPNNTDLLLSLLAPGNTLDRGVNMTWAASADGALWSLPAGALRVAVGAEHRRESAKLSQSLPENPLLNLSLLGNFDRSIDSGYLEALLPLVSPDWQLPLVHRLDFTAAGRYDRYSDVGGDFSPRYGVQWRPLSWMLLRGTHNEAFRAPGLQSLYRPVTEASSFFRAGRPVYDSARNGELLLGFIPSLIGGNPSLRPERSESRNFGVVLELPLAALDGLSVSADMVRLRYVDRIALANSQIIIDLFPERLVRGDNLPGDPAGIPGPIVRIDSREVNIARTDIRSIDYQVKFSRTTGHGTFDFRAAATVYDGYSAQNAPGAPIIDTSYRWPTRYTWQSYWSRGPLGLGVSGFMQAKSYRSPQRTQLRLDSVREWNLQMAYDFGRSAAGNASWLGELIGDTKISLTIFNVLDQEPPHIEGRAGFAVTDPRMRRYSLSLQRTF